MEEIDIALRKINEEYERVQNSELKLINMNELSPELKELFITVPNNVTLDSVILSENNRKQISSFLNELKFTKMFEKFNLRPINRLLFYGASGCGKTELAKALHNVTGYSFLYLDVGAIYTRGNIAEQLTKVFNLADDNNCIIFLDECDSIAWERTDTVKGGTNTETRVALNHLFTLIDNMSPNIILIAATNMKSHIDTAFLTRFPDSLPFERPTSNIFKSILTFTHEEFVIVDNISETSKTRVDAILEEMKGFSYRELANIVNKGMKNALMSNTNVIKLSTLYEDILITLDRDLKLEIIE